jgi:stress response protein YsnF
LNQQPSATKQQDKNMTTLQLIMEAIGAMKDRTGSSVFAINKYIETEKKVSGRPVVSKRQSSF